MSSPQTKYIFGQLKPDFIKTGICTLLGFIILLMFVGFFQALGTSLIFGFVGICGDLFKGLWSNK